MPRHTAPQTIVDALPLDLLEEIVCRVRGVSAKKIARLGATSRSFHALYGDDGFWKRQCARRGYDTRRREEGHSWREHYRLWCLQLVIPDSVALQDAVRAVLPHGAPYRHPLYGPIAEWDTSEITDMRTLFFEAHNFNGDLSRWDTSSVNDMYGMFMNATSFNGDLSRWDTSKVDTMFGMFRNATSFNGDLSRWDTSKLKTMSHMFMNATSFNGDLSKWDTSKVETMFGMFCDAPRFNGDLSRWDTSNVEGMSHMFRNETSCDGDLS